MTDEKSKEAAVLLNKADANWPTQRGKEYLQKALALFDDEKCRWILIDGDYGFWQTGCNNGFEFTDSKPKENHFKFCPYCGREIEVEEK